MENLDVSAGELYLFPEEDGDLLYEFEGRRRDGAYVLKNEKSGRKRAIADTKFVAMRCDGRAVRVSTSALRRTGDLPGDIDPAAFLPADNCGLTVRQRAARLRAIERMAEARTLRFYVIKHDHAPDGGRSTVSLERLIDEHKEEAASYGLSWRPSASSLRRALDRYGEPGDRPLVCFLERRRVHSPAKRWHHATLGIKQRMLDFYWGDRKVRVKDAIKFFNDEFTAEASRRQELGEVPLVRPSRETLRCWINAEGGWDNWKRRYGEREANRRFRGRGPGIEASRFLETVVIDHTRVDEWVKVIGPDGKTIIAERPWLTLALDLHTRAIVAAVLTFDPPSILTLMECLKQIVRPKDWLIAEFGEGMAASAWGKPGTLVLDNEWAHVGVSFQAFCEAAGIDLVFAPLKTPEFKGHVERLLRTVSEEVFHRLPGAVPHKPSEMSERELDPRSEDLLTIEELRDRFWRWNCTDYSMRVHRGIGMAPARALKLSLEQHGRPTIDDIRSLDKLMGQTARCQLSAIGVEIDGHTFHHPETVTRLLDELLRTAPKGRRKPKSLAGGRVWVVATKDPTTCEYIYVWNYVRRRNEKLWNVDRRFAQGCSWKLAKAIKKHVAHENLAFETDEQKLHARRSYEATLVPAMKEQPFRTARKLVPLYKRATPGLVLGDKVITAVAEPSVSGMQGFNVPHGLAAPERADDRIPPKGPRRGGKAATRKAAATRARNAARRKGDADATQAAGAPPHQNDRRPTLTPQVRSRFKVADASDLLAQLSADLDEEN